MATLKKGGAALTAQDQADFRDGLGLTGALTLTESGLTKGGVALTSSEMAAVAGDLWLGGVGARHAEKVIAHRGAGMLVAPDNSLASFEQAVASGLRNIEFDVYQLSDYSLGVMHDSTVDRTTSGTGTTADFDRAGFKALSLDPGAWLAPAWTSEAPPMLEDVVRTVSKSGAVMWIEAKNEGAGKGVAAVLGAHGIARNMAVVLAFTQSWLTHAVDAGYQTLLFGNSELADFEAIAAAGITMYGDDASWTDVDIARAHAAGLKVVVYTYDYRNQVDGFFARGADFVVSNDPLWTSRSTTPRSRDPFAAMTWAPGMIPTAGDARGTFSGGKLRLVQASGYKGVLQGWACPLPDPTNWSMSFGLTFEAVSAADRWFGAHICSADDTRYLDTGAAGQPEGYNVVVRQNGTVQIYKTFNGSASTKIGEAIGTSLTIGTEYTVDIAVTGATVTATCNGFTATATDATRRGAYFHFGTTNARCLVGNVVIS